MSSERTPGTELLDPAAVLRHYLWSAREALWWKLDGLSEREVRLPRTPTGTNLLGIVKHCLNVEAGYFGPTFGRTWPTPEELVPMTAYDTDPQADWYATAEEARDGLLDLHRRVGEFADETIAGLGLDARGRVPWWPPERGEVTLHRIAVHVLGDLTRHAGHADILREGIDGAVGMVASNSNVPDGPGDTDWPTYVARLAALADRFA
ncbi:DinB family protein [Nocardioides panacisoli]|uniref:DinB family protein n=1 Tax=Nocardioides panacisoli TaxID=627624 RepID=UPI001C6288AA|nr:DinB family protein [Nocardioides panacisoli]QYJ03392.1 DinB family protein [Nocardioides panacisoli]